MKKCRRWAGILVSAVLAAGAIASCREAEPPSPPAPSPCAGAVQPFLDLVDADALFYLGLRGWKDLEIFDFIQTARRLRIVERLKEIGDQGLPDFPRRGDAERRLRKLAELREKVSLRELLGGEFALAVFPGEPGRPPVPALIFRLPEEKADLYADYFRRLAELSLAAGEEIEGEGSRITWSRTGDILVAAAGKERVEKINARLLGRGTGPSLAEDPRFRESFRGMDPSGRGVFYLRVRPLAARLAALLREEYPERPPAGVFLPARTKAGYYLRRLRRAVETVERIAGTFDFDPRGYRDEFRLYLDEDAGSRAVLDLVKRAPRSWEVLDYIPAGSAGFSAGFLDPGKVYRLLAGFLAVGSREGREMTELWAEKQEAAGIRVEEDILSWLGDEYAFATISLGSSFFDPGSWALLLRVGSAGEADRFLDLLRSRAAELNVVEEEYGGAVFHVLYLPIPLLPAAPTAGRVGDFLVLASRRDVFTEIVDTYSGQQPGIRQNPDFQRLEAELGSEGTAIYFSRLEDQIEALIATIRSSSAMLGLFLPPPSAEAAEGEPAGPDSGQVIDLLNDFTRVLEEFKIFRFRAGISLYRDGYIQSRSVVEIGR
ncbi:MAG: DUF3352 domain-containing protein [Candidatus Erginobacter occultus]|nr:DUF3352 domain-containing protein [Candidatus Erginobacter occultus]